MNAEAAGPTPPASVSVSRARTAAQRTGLPVWRMGKPDAVLAAAVESAREAVQSIAEPSAVGGHLAARTEGDRIVTHLFECRLPGYPGWQWFAVLTRNSRSKTITVNEVGLLPSEDSVLAPEWVPWAQRVRPEDQQEEPAPARAEADGPQKEATEGDMTIEDMPAEKEIPETPGALETADTEQVTDAAAAVERDTISSIRHADLGADRIEDSGDHSS